MNTVRSPSAQIRDSLGIPDAAGATITPDPRGWRGHPEFTERCEREDGQLSRFHLITTGTDGAKRYASYCREHARPAAATILGDSDTADLEIVVHSDAVPFVPRHDDPPPAA